MFVSLRPVGQAPPYESACSACICGFKFVFVRVDSWLPYVITDDRWARPTLQIELVKGTPFVVNSHYSSSLKSLMGTGWADSAERSAAKQTACVTAASSKSG